MKQIFILALFAFGLSGQVGIGTLSDITGDGSTHALNSAASARWVQFVAGAANGAAIRIGDSNTGSARGVPLAAGGGFFLPPMPTPSTSTQPRLYILANLYYYAANGDKVSVTWGN